MLGVGKKIFTLRVSLSITVKLLPLVMLLIAYSETTSDAVLYPVHDLVQLGTQPIWECVEWM